VQAIGGFTVGQLGLNFDPNLIPTLPPTCGEVGGFELSHVWLHNAKLEGKLESEVGTQSWVPVVVLTIDLDPNLKTLYSQLCKVGIEVGRKLGYCETP
jgi:hypothetical protein